MSARGFFKTAAADHDALWSQYQLTAASCSAGTRRSKISCSAALIYTRKPAIHKRIVRATLHCSAGRRSGPPQGACRQSPDGRRREGHGVTLPHTRPPDRGGGAAQTGRHGPPSARPPRRDTAGTQPVCAPVKPPFPAPCQDGGRPGRSACTSRQGVVEGSRPVTIPRCPPAASGG